MTEQVNVGAPAAEGRRRRPRMRRVPDPVPLRITPSHRRILELLSTYRYLTAPLLGQLYAQGGRGTKHVHNELGRLYHHGFVSRHLYRAGLPGEGGETFVYVLAPDGARAVLEPEEWRATRHLIYARGQAKENYGHHLAIAGVQVLLSTSGAAWELASFTSDHEDQSRQLRVDVAGLGRRTVWPDAEAIIRLPSGPRVLHLIEVDRSRRANRRVEERFRAYASLVGGSSGARLRAERRVEGLEVLFIEPTESEQKRLTMEALELCRTKVLPAVPPFRFWSMARWWDGPRLRPAAEVLDELRVLTMRGRWERFVTEEQTEKGRIGEGQAAVGRQR